MPSKAINEAGSILGGIYRQNPGVLHKLSNYGSIHPYQAAMLESYTRRHPEEVAQMIDEIAKSPAAGERAEDAAFEFLNLPRLDCPFGNCGRVLGPHDVVGTTFYIACNMMLAFTMFFFVQVTVVPQQWRTSVSIAGLVTGVAWYNYTYMKDQWVEQQISPTQYRYTDWLITVPLQIVEFYFILKASGPVPAKLGAQLFGASLAMVFFGWLAEINFMAKLVGFMLGMASWGYILYEVFSGEAAKYAAMIGPDKAAAQSAFNTLKMIVSVGWSIYPIGFAIAYLCFFDQPAGVLSGLAMGALNIIYNLADLVNKGAFGLCVWSAAIGDKSGPLADQKV